MSLNKSKTSLLTIDKKMSSSQNILKNKSRFAKTEQIDPRNHPVTTDITDTPLAIDPKLDEDVSDVSDLSDLSDLSDIIDKSTIEILD